MIKITLLLFLYSISFSQVLQIPPRPSNALSGSEFIKLIWDLPREEREEVIYSQVINGNIPNFMRQVKAVSVSADIDEKIITVTYFVIPDYLAIGSDSDYFLVPMSPLLAQRICDTLKCVLPTKKMVLLK